MEGQFYRTVKTDKHPHTNMAKAALNMMTRTSAPDFVKDGIHMNAVDTGWVTDEDPAALQPARQVGASLRRSILSTAPRACRPDLRGGTDRYPLGTVSQGLQIGALVSRRPGHLGGGGHHVGAL